MIFVLSILPFLTTSTSTTTFTTSPIIYATTTSILIFISMVVDVMKVALMIMTLLYCYDPMTLYQNALHPSNWWSPVGIPTTFETILESTEFVYCCCLYYANPKITHYTILIMTISPLTSDGLSYHDSVSYTSYTAPSYPMCPASVSTTHPLIGLISFLSSSSTELLPP